MNGTIYLLPKANPVETGRSLKGAGFIETGIHPINWAGSYGGLPLSIKYDSGGRYVQGVVDGDTSPLSHFSRYSAEVSAESRRATDGKIPDEVMQFLAKHFMVVTPSPNIDQ